MTSKKSKLTKREQEIRSYILQEHLRLIDKAAESCGECDNNFWYFSGQLNEVATVLGKVLDILGG